MLSDSTTTLWPLYRRDGSIAGYTLIDAADIPLVGNNVWRLATAGYAYRGQRVAGKVQKISLAREIVGLPRVYDGRQPDHINRDRLDNRRANLRVVTQPQNSQNRAWPRPRATSKYRGVLWHPNHQRWVAQVKRDGRVLWSASFDTEAEAATAVATKRPQLLPYSTD